MSITTTAAAPNRLQRRYRLSEAPGIWRWVRNIVLHRAVPFTSTAKSLCAHEPGACGGAQPTKGIAKHIGVHVRP